MDARNGKLNQLHKIGKDHQVELGVSQEEETNAGVEPKGKRGGEGKSEQCIEETKKKERSLCTKSSD